MDTFAHITIPLLILLALGIKTRKILLLLPLALVMDLDYFFTLGRQLFHNIFVVILIPLLIIIYLEKQHPEYREYGLIAFFFLLSHFIFDLGDGVAFLYPLATDFYYFEMQVFLQFLGPIPLPDISIDMGMILAEDTVAGGGGQGATETAQSYPSMSNISSGLFLTLIVAALMYYRKSFTFLKEVWDLLVDIKSYIFEKLDEIKSKLID
ncbi:MAG: hypothetical protein V5A76_04150 [Candidatus Thermoplasmatota archaeon]